MSLQIPIKPEENQHGFSGTGYGVVKSVRATLSEPTKKEDGSFEHPSSYNTEIQVNVYLSEEAYLKGKAPVTSHNKTIPFAGIPSASIVEQEVVAEIPGAVII